MIQIKKTILTLVALLAVTTGAWADETLLVTITIGSDGNPVYSVEGLVTLTGNNYNTGSSSGVYFWSPNSPSYTLSAPATVEAVEAVADNVSITKVVFWSYDGGYKCPLEDTEKPYVCFANKSYGKSLSDDFANPVDGYTIAKIEVYGTAPAPSGLTVDWNKTSKTGTFTMPAGNVTVSVDYYPQATADGAVTAATDAKATTDAPLVTVDATKLTGAAKMMYYVSTEATAPAYDAEGWTDVLPTAEKYTEAANLNVWYYPVGTDEGVGGATATFSDGDMNATALAVTLGAAPTYNVEFADGTNPEAPADPIWTATPNTGVKKGQTVTVTYTGTRKVIGVKAEKKKAAAPAAKAAAEVTAEDKGKLIGTDGNIYADVAAATAAGTTAVAKIIYIGETGHATYNHGLALALTDEASKMAWQAAIDACSAKNTFTPVTNATWLLASKAQWDYMRGANGAGSYTALRDGFSSVGGSNLHLDIYWSTEYDSDDSKARIYIFDNGSWSIASKVNGNFYVRACLAF